MRQLELLLVPLHHRFRYPLSVPAHLADDRAAANNDGAPRVSSPTLLSNGGVARFAAGEDATTAGALPSSLPDSLELTEEQQYDRVRRAALTVVEEQVPDLLPWQTRVQNGSVQAENSYQVLQHVRSNVAAMQRVTETVQQQSDHLSHNASAMMVRKAKLELVREALEQNLAHFTHIDDLCHEAGNPFLKAGTTRFSTLLQDIANEMEFLSTNTQYKSAKPYAMRLAVAQQMVSATLKEAVRESFKTMEAQTKASPAFVAATDVRKEGGSTPTRDRKSAQAGTAAADGSASAPPPSAAAPPVRSSDPNQLELRRDDVAGSFADFLASVNDTFVTAGDNYTSLRRMAELRQGGFGYAGAEAFGEEMLTASGGIDADSGMKEVLDAYRDARVGVVVPLLRYWLTLWYHLDMQDARSEALSAAEATQVQQQLDTGGSNKQRLTGVAEAHTLPQLAEHICGLLQRSLAAESDVLNRLWLRDDIASYLMPKLVSSIAEEVYYAFRSRLLCVDDVGELSRTVDSIQRVSLRHDTAVQDSQVVADLWLRMIQDTQERLVFRTSVYLRQSVARCTPTREMATVYLRCGNGVYNAAATTSPDGAIAAEAEPQMKMFYLPGVVHALRLLHWLYPTLEFSVFSVFAEEAVHHSIELVRQLVKLMRQVDSSDVLRDTKAYLCQLSHLQHLEAELSHVDANITVVERHISLASLRRSRLELEQSSRESKKEVQVNLLKCSEQLTTAMLAYVTQPMSGAAKKNETERRQLVAEMKGRAAGVERMIAFYVEHAETRVDLVNIIRDRTAELADEVGVSIQGVLAATVPVKTTAAAPPQPVAATESKGQASPLSLASPVEATSYPMPSSTTAALVSNAGVGPFETAATAAPNAPSAAATLSASTTPVASPPSNASTLSPSLLNHPLAPSVPAGSSAVEQQGPPPLPPPSVSSQVEPPQQVLPPSPLPPSAASSLPAPTSASAARMQYAHQKASNHDDTDLV
jgi:conserved oligomeric Golgi complex subunit 3